MKKETIIITKLTASEGMVLTDGKTYGTVIFPEEGKSESDFREITRAEYDALFEAEKEDISDEVVMQDQ